MSEFAKYLTESAKQYEYRIKIAGDIDKDFGTKLEQSLAKFEVAKMSDNIEKLEFLISMNP